MRGPSFSPASKQRPGAFTTPPAMTIGGAARVPSQIRPVNVKAAITITCTDAQSRIVNLEVETGVGTGVYGAVSIARSNPDVSGIGVGITDARTFTLDACVPPGFGYRFTQSGAGTTAITQLREQLT